MQLLVGNITEVMTHSAAAALDGDYDNDAVTIVLQCSLLQLGLPLFDSYLKERTNKAKPTNSQKSAAESTDANQFEMTEVERAFMMVRLILGHAIPLLHC